ncbi:MAG: restriction endonuclease [Halapricum sp.]
MAEIIALSDEERSEPNEQVDGRLGEAYLAEGPLSSYLGDDEEVAFVLHAKRGGMTVERDGGTETYKPTRGHRTVVAITDLRVVIAIGGADGGGDRVVPIPFSAVTRVETDSGLLRERLIVRTEAGERWSMPAGGDFDPVVAYLEDALEAWSRADRFAVRVEDHLATAREHLERGGPEAARDAAEEAVAAIAAGREQVRTFDIGDQVLAHAGFDDYRADVRSIQRRALAARAEGHTERADHYEAEGRLRAASEALADALEATEQALSIDAGEPSDEQLQEQIETVRREQDRLKAQPREHARTELDDARSLDDPQRRAERLRDALAAHRDWLGFAWGPKSSFAGDPDEIRTRILEILEELLDARTAVIERLLAAAERLHAGGRTEQALAACDQADDHLDEARRVVTELAPEQKETLTQWRVEIDHRRGLIERETDGTAGGATDDTGSVAGGTTKAAEWTTPGWVTISDEHRSSRDAELGESSGPDAEEALGGDRRVTAEAEIRTMDEMAFTKFVATCWNALGWETTIFAHSSDQYDIMAIRRQLIDLRVLIWTVHRPGRDLDASTIDRCVTDRSNVERADAAAVVTTADVSDAVRERAAKHDIKLIDREDLLDLLEDEGLAGLVLDGDY